jgi:hypothetical protein
LPLQFREDLGPQIEHHTLTDMIQENFLRVRENEPEQEDTKKYCGEYPNPVGPLRCNEVIDCDLCEVGLSTYKDVREKGKKQSDRDRLPVRLEISCKPASDTKIVRVSDRLLFVIFLRFV